MISLLKKIVKIVACKILYRVKYEGKENIDFTKSHVIVSNHVGTFDGAFIWADIPNLSIMAKEELFSFKPLAWIFTKVGAFPIARGKKDYTHVLHAVNIVNKNEPRNLLIFPEGTRNAKAKNVKAKNGATYIAAVANVSIIPVHITEKMSLFGKVKVKYGKEIILNITKDNIKDKSLLTKETQRIMDVIYNK